MNRYRCWWLCSQHRVHEQSKETFIRLDCFDLEETHSCCWWRRTHTHTHILTRTNSDDLTCNQLHQNSQTGEGPSFTHKLEITAHAQLASKKQTNKTKNLSGSFHWILFLYLHFFFQSSIFLFIITCPSPVKNKITRKNRLRVKVSREEKKIMNNETMFIDAENDEAISLPPFFNFSVADTPCLPIARHCLFFLFSYLSQSRCILYVHNWFWVFFRLCELNNIPMEIGKPFSGL